MFSTAYIAAHYLQKSCQFSGKVYLIGTSGFRHELELAGMQVIGDGVSCIHNYEIICVTVIILQPDPVIGGLNDWVKLELDPDVRMTTILYCSVFTVTSSRLKQLW